MAKSSANVSVYLMLFGQVDVGGYAESQRALPKKSPRGLLVGRSTPELVACDTGARPDADCGRAATSAAMTPGWVEMFSELRKSAARCDQIRISAPMSPRPGPTIILIGGR